MKNIPLQLKHCQFNRVRFKEKSAFESGWQKKPYTYKEIKDYFPRENYGVICNNGLRVLDDDTEDKRLIGMFTEIFGKTFRVRDHLYFMFDNNHDKKIILMNDDEHLGEIQGKNTYVVGAGSTHPSGEIYEVVDDVDIITISYDEFMEYFGEFMKKNIPNTELKVINDEYDKHLIEAFVPQWGEGKRQDLAMNLAGFLRKEEGYGFKHTADIIRKICELAKDTDINERLSAVQQTYLKDERKVKGYTGLQELGIEIKNVDENKDGIIWYDNVVDWEYAKKKSLLEIKNRDELVLYAKPDDTIQGKPQILDQTKKTNLNLIQKLQKKAQKDEDDDEIKYLFIGDSYSRRDGSPIESLNKYFWIYIVIDNDKEYTVLTEEKIPSSEIHTFYGMKINTMNSKELSTELKLKGLNEIFLCKWFEPAIKPLPKEEIIPHTENFIKEHGFDKEMFRDFFFDFIFTHEDGNIYRQPEDYMMMRHAQLLSGKVNGYPLSTLSLGVAGCSKTMEVESIDHVFQEGVLEAGNSTPKSLVPSFKEKPATGGFIMTRNRVALIDELMKMVDNQIMSNGSIGEVRNQLSQLNYLLEHKRRAVGSGNNNSFVGQNTSKVVMVGNPSGKMSFLYQHLKVLDESTLSRFFIWIKGLEHKRFIQSNKILRVERLYGKKNQKSPNTMTNLCNSEKKTHYEKVFGDFIYYYYLIIYDSCQAFTCDVDYEEVERIYKQTLALVPQELKNVWSARGRHHTELIIDGVTKWRRIFEQQRSDFKASKEDYAISERILIKMAQSWSEGLQDLY